MFISNAQYNATPPTLADKQFGSLQLDENGKLLTSGSGGGGAGDASAANQATQITAEQAILAKIIAAPATEAKQDTTNTEIGIVTETAPATDTASSGLNGRLQRIAQRITSFIALLPTSLGSKAAASSLAVTDSTEDIARIGIITETAPATDTASSGLNGRLQRIAQRLTTLNDYFAALDPSGESFLGTIGGTTPIASAQLVRPSDATTYASGDIIANSATGASVVPMEFNVTRTGALLGRRSGRLLGARCVVSAASGTIVLPAFDLLLFRPETSVPFAAAGYPGDNTDMDITAVAYRECVAIISFAAGSWRNKDGGATAAGTVITQASRIYGDRTVANFNLASLSDGFLRGVLLAQNSWAPGAVVNTIDFYLDVDLD